MHLRILINFSRLCLSWFNEKKRVRQVIKIIDKLLKVLLIEIDLTDSNTTNALLF